MAALPKKEKALGVARGKRRYDLPLNRGAGTAFLIALIGLMTFLAVLALSSSFALSAMTKRWSTGLENRVTVEIPAEDINGKVRKQDAIRTATIKTASLLKTYPAVSGVHILSDDEIADLVKPWLGDSILPGKIPLPGLVSVTLKNPGPDTISILRQKIKSVEPAGRLDTHETWLKDLLRFTGALQFAAALVTLVISVTAAAAIAGAIRSRMEVNHAEVEILHIMGANDHYIAKQFQRHAQIMALQGSVGGVVAGALALLVIGWLSGEMGVNLLPDFRLSATQMIMIALVPVAAAAIAALTSRQTVLRVLKDMP